MTAIPFLQLKCDSGSFEIDQRGKQPEDGNGSRYKIYLRINFSSNYTINFQIHWWWLMIKCRTISPPKTPSVSCSSTDWWDRALLWRGMTETLYRALHERSRQTLKASVENLKLRTDLNHRTRLSWCLVFTELERWKQTTWEPKPKIPQSFRCWKK